MEWKTGSIGTETRTENFEIVMKLELVPSADYADCLAIDRYRELKPIRGTTVNRP